MHDEDRAGRSGGNELILSPGEYAFLQDKTTGGVQTHVGPAAVAQTGQLRPIQFRNGKFQEVGLTNAVESCVLARRGQYLILENPTAEDDGLKHPEMQSTNAAVPMFLRGEKIVVPGPCSFSLWPEQIADCVDGHHLRPDQFLLVRVYDEDAAVTNWSGAITKVTEAESGATSVVQQSAETLGLTLGKLMVIRGDQVSFYIPPTGIEIVTDAEDNYVRNALSLEMSEYAVLVDQNGNKRYERGPQIVFPMPTEEFFEENGSIKFRPLELTPTQGLHIKINCDYTDTEWPASEEDQRVARAQAVAPNDEPNTIETVTREFKEGDEVFITGETHPIYYPSEEHSIVSYGDNLVHFATAVSAGQARYVMNKETGIITTRTGPDMILLDPTQEVFVTRILSDDESLLMYPGNQDSLDYNQSLRSFEIPKSGEESVAIMSVRNADYGNSLNRTMRSLSAAAAPAALPDKISRKTTFTKPHSVTLDDRFEGAPALKIWTGFAVLLTKADGTRRVEVGPKVVTLDFDETVAPLHLSTGKPKTTDNLLTTGYLEVSNNKVSDILTVETEDGVCVRLKLSYRVSFTGGPSKWFDVDNYVKFFADHCRSRLKGEARNHSIRDFYRNTVAIVRDNILGTKEGDKPRTGLEFSENGMVITDVEILAVDIVDSEIAGMLEAQQREVITNQIDIDRAKQELEVSLDRERVSREMLVAKDVTRQTKHSLDLDRFEDDATREDLLAGNALLATAATVKLAEEQQKAEDVAHARSLVRRTECADLDLKIDAAQTEMVIAKIEAVSGDFAAAVRELGDKKTLQVVAKAMGPMRLFGGGSLTDILAGFLGDANTRGELFGRLTSMVESGSEE